MDHHAFFSVYMILISQFWKESGICIIWRNQKYFHPFFNTYMTISSFVHVERFVLSYRPFTISYDSSLSFQMFGVYSIKNHTYHYLYDQYSIQMSEFRFHTQQIVYSFHFIKHLRYFPTCFASWFQYYYYLWSPSLHTTVIIVSLITCCLWPHYISFLASITSYCL